MGLDGQLIGHGPGGNEEGRLFSKEACHPFLEGIDRGILSKDIISHLCFSHGLSHACRRLGYGVASEIDIIVHLLSPVDLLHILRIETLPIT